VTGRLLTAEEVAEQLAVPVSWVREHTRSGAIPHVRLGRWIRYDMSDVDEWLEQIKIGGGPVFRKYEPQGRASVVGLQRSGTDVG
jgi:excisionase family DNA binding protein